MTHDEQKPVREAYEANMREHYTLEQLKERNDRNDPNRCHLVMPSEYLIEAAINATNYKYFGDYEMSAEQREAVEILIDAAEAGQAATTREAELLAVIRAMDAALRYVEAHYDGMEKADIVSKAIRLAEQVV